MNRYLVITKTDFKNIFAKSCDIVDGHLNFYGENYNLISSFSLGQWEKFELIGEETNRYNAVIMGGDTVII